jgi:hypothetical protein
VLNDCGVIYLVLNRPIFMQMCMLSMLSLRKSGYEGPIAIATNVDHDIWQCAAELWNQELIGRYNFIKLIEDGSEAKNVFQRFTKPASIA